MVRHLVIFGAAGDLSTRYLLPALVQLYEKGKLPENIRVIGVHRRDRDEEQCRRFAQESLRHHGGERGSAGRPEQPSVAPPPEMRVLEE